jgi:hypothetical protein
MAGNFDGKPPLVKIRRKTNSEDGGWAIENRGHHGDGF